jgi:hypothetical protein
MTRKTRDLYTAVMRSIARVYQDRFPDAPITITECVTDYELALMGAIPDVILEAEARGCWFHYGQAIIRKAGELGLNKNYRNGGVVAHIVQEMIGLALLPPNRIYEGFAVRCVNQAMFLEQMLYLRCVGHSTLSPSSFISRIPRNSAGCC